MKQSELNFKENNKSFVWAEWNGIEFNWERGSGDLMISGKSYDETISFGIPEKATAAQARKVIINWLAQTFGV